MSSAPWVPSWDAPSGFDADGVECHASFDWLLHNLGPPPPDPELVAAIRAAVREELAAREGQQAAAGGDLRALVTIKEARALLRCSDRQIRRLVATGEIGSVRNVRSGSSRVLIPRESLRAFLDARRH
jgi:excisionase family DNA binding protein